MKKIEYRTRGTCSREIHVIIMMTKIGLCLVRLSAVVPAIRPDCLNWWRVCPRGK